MEKHFPHVPVMLCFFETSPEKHSAKEREKVPRIREESEQKEGVFAFKHMCLNLNHLFWRRFRFSFSFKMLTKKNKKRGQH